MTAALNPTGIWDSSVRKAAEERSCGHVHGSRGNESRRGSPCARIHLDPTSRQRGEKRTQILQTCGRRGAARERRPYLSSAVLRSAGANPIEMGGGVTKAATTAAQTSPPLGHFQILTMTNFRVDSLTP